MNASVLSKIVRDVAQFGWHCLHVYPRTGEAGIGFTYTIGLGATFGRPEIAIFGLSREISHAILSDCVTSIRNGSPFPLEIPIAGVVSGDYMVQFRSVRPHKLEDCFGAAMRFYRDKPFSATVLFWQNKQYLFPWESAAPSVQAEGLALV
jgi:hypothetical protein